MPGVMIGWDRPGRASAGEGMDSGLDVEEPHAGSLARVRDGSVTFAGRVPDPRTTGAGGCWRNEPPGERYGRSGDLDATGSNGHPMRAASVPARSSGERVTCAPHVRAWVASSAIAFLGWAIGPMPGPAGPPHRPASVIRAYEPRVTRTSSISASTRLSAPPSVGHEPDPHGLAGVRGHRQRHRVRQTPLRSAGLPTTLQTTVCEVSARSMIAPQRVGAGRVRVVREDVAEGQPLAGRRGQRDRRASGGSSRPSRSFAFAEDPAAAPVTNDASSRTWRVAALLRAADVARRVRVRAGEAGVRRRRCRSRRGSPATRAGPRGRRRRRRSARLATAAPRTESGHQARSIRYSTASLLRPVSAVDLRVVGVVLHRTSRRCTRRSDTSRTRSRGSCPR